MAGHNKWSKIKHKKATADARKSKVFGKLTALLLAESKKSGGDRSSPGLKSAIDRARGENMPMVNIDRAIERGNSGDGPAPEKIIYEAYGPGGCALLIETLTDNRNRSSAEIRHILSKHGTGLGAKGSAAWLFAQNNETTVPNSTVTLSDGDRRKLEMLVADLTDQDDTHAVHTNGV